LAAIFKTRKSAEWLSLLEKAGVPAGPIYKMDEVFADPQVQHLGIAAPVKNGAGKPVALVGQPIDLSRTPAAITRLLPEAGADNETVFGDLGLTPAEIETLRKERAI
jgi:crotonobetainyl-CoA:carnitine CoA-transferase CaiB-like acyl-CoA transferase